MGYADSVGLPFGIKPIHSREFGAWLLALPQDGRNGLISAYDQVAFRILARGGDDRHLIGPWISAVILFDAATFPFLNAPISQPPISAGMAAEQEIEPLAPPEKLAPDCNRWFFWFDTGRVDGDEARIGANPYQAIFVGNDCPAVTWLSCVRVPWSIELFILVAAKLAVACVKPNAT